MGRLCTGDRSAFQRANGRLAPHDPVDDKCPSKGQPSGTTTGGGDHDGIDYGINKGLLDPSLHKYDDGHTYPVGDLHESGEEEKADISHGVQRRC